MDKLAMVRYRESVKEKRKKKRLARKKGREREVTRSLS
jgi:hypothetical protein